jgi:hypothetical protein
MDFNQEHRKGVLKTGKAAFDRLQAFDAARAKSAKEIRPLGKRKVWAGQRSDKEEADKKTAETMEAVREFNEARDKEKEPSVGHPDGSKS